MKFMKLNTGTNSCGFLLWQLCKGQLYSQKLNCWLYIFTLSKDFFFRLKPKQYKNSNVFKKHRETDKTKQIAELFDKKPSEN